jgi:ribonuclease T2
MRLSRPIIVAAAAIAAMAGTWAFDAMAQRAGGEPFGGFKREVNPAGRAPNQAGQFDYYLLSLSWSPSYCAGLERDRYDPQCHSRDGRRFAFVLHGLWPQYERGWPQDCPTADRGFVPRPVAQRMLDIMPSERLAFHQYRKHGVCSGLGVDGYFAKSRQLFESVKIPDKFRNISDPRMFVSPDETIQAFLAANPQLKPDSIAVQCGGPGNRLQEVRICFDRQGNSRNCGRNEDQRRLCSANSMYVPPVRSGPPGPAPAQSPGLKEKLWQSIPGAGQRI